ncbi:hypothetical protein FDECE_4238 [Fusarium decemcellulare]|nr:hypothetical protein FDECE_4238 [Fusarium decemcellulare]
MGHGQLIYTCWGNSGPTATSVLNRHAHGGGSHLQQVKSGEGWDGATRLINRTQPREQHTRRGRPIPPPSSKAQFRSASRQAPLLLLLPPIIAIHITVKETEASARQEEKNDKKAFASHLRFFSILSDFSKVANLDFEARVPVPFSIFPSTYRESESQTQTVTETHEEVEIKPQQPQAGREGQYSSVSATAEQVPPRGEQRYSEEEVRITREEERYRRPGVQKFEQEQFTIREEHRRYNTPHAQDNNNKTQHNPFFPLAPSIAAPELAPVVSLLPSTLASLDGLAITHMQARVSPPSLMSHPQPSRPSHHITPRHTPPPCTLPPPPTSAWLGGPQPPKLLFHVPRSPALGALARWPEPGLSRAVEHLRGRPPPVAI